MRAKELPDLDTLRRLFYIDKENNLRNRITRGHNAPKGELAGYKRPDGYWQTKIHRMYYKNHRIIYALHYGELPPPDMEIDHRDRDKSNNDPSNLVLVSHRDNCNNVGMRSDNTSDVIGVCYDKQTDKWMAYIRINGKQKNLGRFTDKPHAVVARAEADLKYGTYTGTNEPQSITWLRENGYKHLIPTIDTKS